MRDDRSDHFPLGNQVRLEALSRDPYPVLKALQEQEPISWVGELQAWFVTRRADCLTILLDSTTYSVASSASLRGGRQTSKQPSRIHWRSGP